MRMGFEGVVGFEGERLGLRDSGIVIWMVCDVGVVLYFSVALQDRLGTGHSTCVDAASTLLLMASLLVFRGSCLFDFGSLSVFGCFQQPSLDFFRPECHFSGVLEIT